MDYFEKEATKLNDKLLSNVVIFDDRVFIIKQALMDAYMEGQKDILEINNIKINKKFSCI